MVITIVANATPTGLVVIAQENYALTVVAILNVLVAARATAAPAHVNVLMVTAVPHASVSPARTTANGRSCDTSTGLCSCDGGYSGNDGSIRLCPETIH